MVDTKYTTLATGAKMPLVGLGLWKIPRKDTADMVYNAIKLGYRLFDGAYDYQNEVEAGQGVKRAIDEELVKREDLFIVSKLWNHYHKRENALEMGRSQLKSWGLDYFDLFLIHFPVALSHIDPKVKEFPGWFDEDGKTTTTENVPIRETWEALEELVDQQLVKAIGVSNFQGQAIHDIIRYATHPISALQIEHHPYLTQLDLISLAQEERIAVMAYCSFGPTSFGALEGKFGQRAKNAESLLESEKVKAIGKKYNKTSAQVLLRWATQRDIIVIPKSSSEQRLKENLEVFDFDLKKEDMEELTNMDIGLRFNDPGYYLEKPLRIFA